MVFSSKSNVWLKLWLKLQAATKSMTNKAFFKHASFYVPWLPYLVIYDLGWTCLIFMVLGYYTWFHDHGLTYLVFMVLGKAKLSYVYYWFIQLDGSVLLFSYARYILQVFKAKMIPIQFYYIYAYFCSLFCRPLAPTFSRSAFSSLKYITTWWFWLRLLYLMSPFVLTILESTP